MWLAVFQTTLAHIIASTSKKKGTARFVTLSATSTSTNEVREVIKQAQNELRLCKRKTILFIDEIHRFNKSQQVRRYFRAESCTLLVANFLFFPLLIRLYISTSVYVCVTSLRDHLYPFKNCTSSPAHVFDLLETYIFVVLTDNNK